MKEFRSHALTWFLLGAACFFIAQPLIRIPILAWLNGTVAYILFAATSPALIWPFLGFSAGLAEEGMRYLFKRWLVRPTPSSLAQPVIFGLGHGLMEAFYLLLPSFMAGYGPLMGLAIIERVIAIAMHVGLSVTIWNGFQTGARWQHLLAAITIHGLINSSLGVFQALTLGPVAIEAILAGYALALLAYVVYSRRHYFPSRAGIDTGIMI